MSCSRREITSYQIEKYDVILTYKDYSDSLEKQLTFNLSEKLNTYSGLLQIIMPFFDYEIGRCGSTFKVCISEEKMMYIREHFPDIYNYFPIECKKNNIFFNEYDIHRLVLDEKSKNGEVEEYDLLYIGKSNARNDNYDIIDRLSNHKTIQKITRDNNTYYRDKELIIMLIAPKSNLFKEIKEGLISIGLGTEKWEKEMLLGDMEEKYDVVPFIEIILIYHFKPKYNQLYVDNLSMETKLYEKFKEQDVNPVSIELDINNGKGRYEIRTKETKTETRLRNIECYKKNDKISIRYDDLPEILYDML